ncbi:glycosyl hydrolase [Aeromicrobium flavum]|uniref:4,4'-diaponeurosporenoate glycosyltransferase n=1 Tax=Aeromicrobium flavum TaxID=416568 RepID=A0A512HU69_9ACTN|nr:glycosyl hydrolase [Aeromicrobium flavum]
MIPVHDDATELRACLSRLAAGTELADEIVIVDNASADDSADVARAFGARVVVEPVLGIPVATAAGYDAATGDVIARLDADSRPGPDWIARVARAMADPQVDAVTGPGRFHDLPAVLRPLAGLVYLGAYFALTYLALAHVPLWGSSMAIRRTSWERVRGDVHRFDDVHDDMDLAFVLGPEAVICYDRSLRVGVSARSLRGMPQLRRRMRRAVTTLRLNWAVRPPWVRWQDRLRSISAD